MRFSPHTLGNLIHRTRLKLAASMLHFQEYGDFADYFGSRWHYYLGAITQKGACAPRVMKCAALGEDFGDRLRVARRRRIGQDREP
jgi:hypothetical protein